MQSVMSHNFGQTPSVQAPRSVFDRSSGFKLAIDADYIYPIFLDEIVPGDQMRMNAQLFGRMNTPIFPIMDNLHFDTFWFFVPYRILFDNFRYMLGEQDSPGDSIDFTFPTMTSTTSTGYLEDSLHDYLGIPPGIPDFVHCVIPHRAYNAINQHWFRNQNLQNEYVVNTDAGPDTVGDYTLLKRCKRHDYFTSALPWPQRGSTAVSLPLGTSANVYTTGAHGSAVGAEHTAGGTLRSFAVVGAEVTVDTGGTSQSALFADLQNATSATINAIRLAVSTQQFLERDARGGTRANEIIRSHFGVTVPDYRAVYPEYLGGSTDRISIQQVPQTSQTATTPQGTLSAFGTLQSRSSWSKSFTEFGLIMGLANVRADITYQKGVDKIWTRSSRYDLYWPDFAQLGEQSILQQEIELTDPAGATNENVFGYILRFDDLRFKPSRMAGPFRSTHSGSLDPWHLSEELSTPALNATFIQSNTPMDRVEAVAAEADFTIDCWFDYNCVRPIPLNGVPGLTRF